VCFFHFYFSVAASRTCLDPLQALRATCRPLGLKVTHSTISANIIRFKKKTQTNRFFMCNMPPSAYSFLSHPPGINSSSLSNFITHCFVGISQMHFFFVFLDCLSFGACFCVTVTLEAYWLSIFLIFCFVVLVGFTKY
jgi:hypothetical protein